MPARAVACTVQPVSGPADTSGHPGAAPGLEATGERLVPEAYRGELVHAEHMARYLLAARLAPGRRVLDAACGEGYGSALLAAAGASAVVGVDVDGATVEHARGRYGLDVRTADVTDLPFAPGDFDLIVSFETIEHVADPEKALSEFARILGDDGLLIVSTPNVDEYLVDNPFHLRELTPAEFNRALTDRFAAVRPLYQQNFLASAVLDAPELRLADPATPVPAEVRKVAGAEPGRALYCLALCGPRDLPALDAGVTVLSGIYEAHHAAAEAGRIHKEWEARAHRAEVNQQEWEARAREAERQNEELHATLDRIAGSVSWRITKPLRKVKGRSS